MNDLPQMPTPYQQHQQQYPKKHSSSVQQPYSGQKVKYQPPPPPPQQQQQQQYKAPRTNSSHSVPYQPQQQPQQQQQAYAVPPTPQSQYMYSQQQQPQQYAPMPQAPIYHHQQQPQPPMYQHMSSQPQHPQQPLPPQPQQIQQTYASSPQNGAMMYSNPHAAQSVPAPQQHYQLPPQSVSQQQIPQGRHTSSSSQQHFDQNQYIPQSHTSHPVSKKPPPPQQQSSSSQPSQPSQMMMQQTDSPPRMHQHYKQPSNRSKESLSTNNNNNNNNSTALTSKQKLEIELRSVFEKVDTNKSGRISAKELSYALLNFDHTRFHESTIKLMLNLFTAQKKSDGSSSSTSSSSYGSSNKSLNFDQFVSLWKYLSAYKKLFIQADADKSGDISFGEFQKILEQIGYKLDIDLVLHLFSKYTAKSDGGLGGGGEIGRLKFDMFIELLIYLRKLTDIFKKYDKDLSGTATIGFSDFLFEISNMS